MISASGGLPAHRYTSQVIQRWPRGSEPASIPHCTNSVLYVDSTEMPKFGGYALALVVTCGLTRFTRVFPCTKHISGEETIKILLEEWFCVYGAPKESNSDEDVPVRCKLAGTRES